MWRSVAEALPPGTSGVGRSGRKAWARGAPGSGWTERADRRPPPERPVRWGEAEGGHCPGHGGPARHRRLRRSGFCPGCHRRAAILNLLRDIVAESGISLFFITTTSRWCLQSPTPRRSCSRARSSSSVQPARSSIAPSIPTPGDSSRPPLRCSGVKFSPEVQIQMSTRCFRCPLRPSVGRHYQGGNP